MKFKRTVSYLSGGIALALSLLVYLEYVHSLGFPDGFITELGYAERRLAFVFIGVSVVSALCLFYLGSVASRRQIKKQLSAVIILYLVFVAGICLIDYYYRLHLTGGGGG